MILPNNMSAKALAQASGRAQPLHPGMEMARDGQRPTSHLGGRHPATFNPAFQGTIRMAAARFHPPAQLSGLILVEALALSACGKGGPLAHAPERNDQAGANVGA